VTFRDYFRGALALARSITAGRVNPELAQGRAQVCAGCTWMEVSPVRWVRWVSRAYEVLFPPYGLLEPWMSKQPWRCQLCHCPLRTKLRLPLDFILRHTSPELFARLPRFCWIKTGKVLDQKPAPVEQ